MHLLSKLWKLAKSVLGIVLIVIGLAGIPENIQTWGNWISDFALYVNQEWARWAFMILALLLFSTFFPWWQHLKTRFLGKTTGSAVWFERDQLELYVIACLSSNKSPGSVRETPELPRHRLLKDAIRDGKLTPVDENHKESPNVWTRVSISEFKKYLQEYPHSDFSKLLESWEVVQKSRPPRTEQARILLSEAALIAYEETYGYPVTKFAEAQPGGPIGYFAILLTDKGKTPVYGIKPPMRNSFKIPENEIKNGFVTDDGKSIIFSFNDEPKYINLEIRKSDMYRIIEEVKGWELN